KTIADVLVLIHLPKDLNYYYLKLLPKLLPDSCRSSLTTAARASGLRPRSQRAMRTDKVCRSRPVSKMFDIRNTSSNDSLAVSAAS
ncbi:unnamed protein product, partial [Brassica rapa subsp. narinosa]